MQCELDSSKINVIIRVTTDGLLPQGTSKTVDKLNEIRNWPDSLLYLAWVFAFATDQPLTVRQACGLLIKSWINGPVKTDIIDKLKLIISKTISDPNEVIRDTAGSIITKILFHHGCDFWPEILDELLQTAKQACDPSTVLTSMRTIQKICEDELVFLEEQMIESSAKQLRSQFIAFSTERLLPLLFEVLKNVELPLSVLLVLMKILNEFARAGGYEEDEFAFQFFDSYLATIGRFAVIGNPSLDALVTEGINQVFEYKVNALMPVAENIVWYMLKCSQSQSYEVKFNAFQFWTRAAENVEFQNYIQRILPQLVPLIISNAVYTDHDFADLNPDQFSDDIDYSENNEYSIPRDYVDGNESDDEDFQMAWGSSWTIRKAAALLLDNLCKRYADEVVAIALPIIKSSIQDPDWKVRESIVLIVGAISNGSNNSLFPYVSELVQYFVALSYDKIPCVRSICCWTLARFTSMFLDNDCDEMFNSIILCIIGHIRQKNRSVQDAACSALNVITEKAGHLLYPFLIQILQCFAAEIAPSEHRILIILCQSSSNIVSMFSHEVIATDEHQQAFRQYCLVLIDRFTALPCDRIELSYVADALTVVVNTLHTESYQLAFILVPHIDKVISTNLQILFAAIEANKHDAYSKPQNTEVLELVFDLVEALTTNLDIQITHLLDNSSIIQNMHKLATVSYTEYRPLQLSIYRLLSALTFYHFDSVQRFIPDYLIKICSNISESNFRSVTTELFTIRVLVNNCINNGIEFNIAVVMSVASSIMLNNGFNSNSRNLAALLLAALYRSNPSGVLQLLSSTLPHFCNVLKPDYFDNNDFRDISNLFSQLKTLINSNDQMLKTLEDTARRIVKAAQNMNIPKESIPDIYAFLHFRDK